MFRHPSWRLRKFSGGLLGFSSELAKGIMVWERAVKVSIANAIEYN